MTLQYATHEKHDHAHANKEKLQTTALKMAAAIGEMTSTDAIAERVGRALETLRATVDNGPMSEFVTAVPVATIDDDVELPSASGVSVKRRRELISFARAGAGGGTPSTADGGAADAQHGHEPGGATKVPRSSKKVFWSRDAFFSRVSVRQRHAFVARVVCHSDWLCSHRPVILATAECLPF
jgi:hypothetical protein